MYASVIEIHWIEKNYVVKEGATVELCAIGSGALRKDIVVMVNVSLNTGKYYFYLQCHHLV